MESLVGSDFEIVCVNDGSRDGTLARLTEFQSADKRIRVVDLSRNFGKEAALTAGLDFAKGDAVVPIDADLQDPPEMIPAMIEQWRQGYDIVLAKRIDRSSDSWFKRTTVNLFYRIHNRIAETTIPDNIGDFRLLDRKIVEVLGKMPERRRFMKGMFAWVGFKTATVTYTRPQRVQGASKFSAWRLLNFAIEGITSFSTVPLRIWSYFGLLASLSAFGYALLIVLRTILLRTDVPGYTSLLTAVLFFGGLQLIGLGVLGEYVGRIYVETKQRPVYVVRNLYEGHAPRG